LQIIDSLLESGYSQILYNYHLNDKDTLNYVLSDLPNYDYIEHILLNTAQKNNIPTRKVNPTNPDIHYIKIFPVRIEIIYRAVNDDFIRIITMQMNSAKFLPNGEIKNTLEGKYHFTDTLSENDINFIEDETFPISKGKKEEKKMSFFDKILEPAIIVATSAITVILFFTVRSK
jgi:hypothetical protein